jgi:hypothetical protein
MEKVAAKLYLELQYQRAIFRQEGTNYDIVNKLEKQLGLSPFITVTKKSKKKKRKQ